MSRLLQAIARRPIALDAGMGTRLIALGLDPRHDDPSLWNVDRPAEVAGVHARDARAGAVALLTNTFGANRSWLSRFDRVNDLKKVNRAAVELARGAAGESGFVLGDIGPTAADGIGAAREQAEILMEAGVDGLVLETFPLEAAIADLRELASIPGRPPLIASLWAWPEPVEAAARRLVDAGADVIGSNCRPALPEMLEEVRRLASAVPVPLLVKPGIDPDDPEGSSTPSTFASAVRKLVRYNVRMIGGCCGTTEAHVEAVAGAIAALDSPPIDSTRQGPAT